MFSFFFYTYSLCSVILSLFLSTYQNGFLPSSWDRISFTVFMVKHNQTKCISVSNTNAVSPTLRVACEAVCSALLAPSQLWGILRGEAWVRWLRPTSLSASGGCSQHRPEETPPASAFFISRTAHTITSHRYKSRAHDRTGDSGQSERWVFVTH